MKNTYQLHYGVLFSAVFAANHLRLISSFAPLCDRSLPRPSRGDLCVEILTPFDSDSATSARIFSKDAQNRFFQIRDLHALSFSVFCKSCVCHSCENCRVSPQQFPLWNSEPPVASLSPFLYPLFTIPYPLSYQALAHSFALFCTNAELNSFLFKRFRTLSQKHGGVGVRLSPKNRQKPRLGYTLLCGGSLVGSCQKHPAHP